MITLTVPISHADVHLLPAWVKVVQALGPYKGFSAFLFPDPTVIQEAEQAKAELAGLFDNVDCITASTVITKGWPVGPNQHFAFVANWALGNVPQAFYFMELDSWPVQKQWLQALNEEFQASGKAYMGVITPTLRRRRNPDGTPGERFHHGQHMVGTGIYPAKFAGVSALIHHLNSRMPWSPGPIEPFDTRISEEVVHFAHHTELIQHNLRTWNYHKIQAEQCIGVTCDDDPSNFKNSNHAKPITPNAVVVHGCKDTTLAEIVLEEYGAGKLDSPPARIAPVPAPPNEDIKPKINHPSFIAVSIRKLIETPGKGWRVPALAEEFKVSEVQIREALKEQEAIIEITKPGGWVKLKSLAKEAAVA